jgi:hypothetical protein
MPLEGEGALIESARHPQGMFYGVELRPHAVRRPFRKLSRVDEARLVLPAAGVISRADLLMSRTHARRMRQCLKAEYDAMRQESPGLFSIPGSQDLTANDLAFLSSDTGHYFAYLPEIAPGEKLGAMVFLHGHAGNFRLLIWRWRSLARRAGLAVLAPSCGFGFWGRNSERIVTSALEDACRRWPVIDPGRGLWLVGLSAGGSGVIRAAKEFDWHGLAFLSAVIRRDLSESVFTTRPDKVPKMLVLNGLRDHNVSPRSVSRGVERFESMGARVEHFAYDEEDHFLLFAQSEDVDRRMMDWMTNRKPISGSGP